MVLTRPGGGGSASAGEIFAQPAAETGPDPFTSSTATDSSAPPVSPSTGNQSAPDDAVRQVDGGAPGLYGGTRNVSSCDTEKQIRLLTSQPEKNRAFASVEGISPEDVPGFLRSLTPVQLRLDTHVTNHGYRDGRATGYQAVLQAGTAVLVDDRGLPRVRCACGNPLTPPVMQPGTPERTGRSWPSYDSANVVVVQPATVEVKQFVLYDNKDDDHRWFARPHGDHGRHDKPAKPPHRPTPTVTVTSPSEYTPCRTTTGATAPGCPTSSVSQSTGRPTTTPPTSPTPSTSSGSESPSSSTTHKTPTTKTPSSDTTSPSTESSQPPSSDEDTSTSPTSDKSTQNLRPTSTPPTSTAPAGTPTATTSSAPPTASSSTPLTTIVPPTTTAATTTLPAPGSPALTTSAVPTTSALTPQVPATTPAL